MNPSDLSAVAFASDDSTNSHVVDACRGVLEKHARSFSAAALFLTPQMRDDAAIAYAFCRMVDDAVDEADSDLSARRHLASIEAMLESKVTPLPVIFAYRKLCQRSGIGLGPARELICGAKSDLGRVRLESDEDFFLYCYRVAGTVGLMMCGILGVTDKNATGHATDLGIAMQITNICRDVLEDSQRDRVYLPRQRLLKHGVDSEDVARIGSLDPATKIPGAVRDGVARVVEDLLNEAESYYRSGAAGFHYIPRRPRLAIFVARSLYREIGVTLRAADSDPLRGRVSVKAPRKLFLTTRSAVQWVLGMF